MKIFEITYKITNEKYKWLSELAERYKIINGWGEKEMLQFAFDQVYETDINKKLEFLEYYIDKLEYEMETGHDDGEYYVENITDEEREICRRVVSAYEEEFENMEILVVEAGKHGFYKMLFSSFPTEVDDAIVFTSGMELFNDLWEEWLEAQLLMQMKDTPMLELDYDEMLECLPEEKREELMAKRQYFAQKAGIV